MKRKINWSKFGIAFPITGLVAMLGGAAAFITKMYDVSSLSATGSLILGIVLLGFGAVVLFFTASHSTAMLGKKANEEAMKRMKSQAAIVKTVVETQGKAAAAPMIENMKRELNKINKRKSRLAKKAEKQNAQYESLMNVFNEATK